MKPESIEQAEATGAGASGEFADPFAVDLFAAGRAPAPAATPQGEAQPAARNAGSRPSAGERPWHVALPKLSREEARRSAMLAALPPALASEARDALARALARLSNVEPQEVQLEVVGRHETSLKDLAAATSSGRAFWTLCVEPEGAPVKLALDADFAASLADRLLGGEGAPPASLRPLSPTERAVVELLCLRALHELNALAGEPLFRLEGASDSLAPSADDARLIVATFRVRVGPTVGLARLIFDEAALAALSVADNPLLARANRGPGARSRSLEDFKRLAADVSLSLVVGETRLTAYDLAELERGDVVIVERPFGAKGAGRLEGRLSLRAGAGRGVVITGRVAAARPPAVGVEGGDAEEAGTLALAVESVEADAGRNVAERIDMAEEEGRLEAGAEGAAALEGLLLTVHVELAARRISLEELSRLRVGQLVELGCRPTDPVELVADGRRVAAGELVDIEGRLGVRVTRLLG